jgi:hypothetical protein
VVLERVGDPDLVVGLSFGFPAPHLVRSAVLDPDDVGDLSSDPAERLRGDQLREWAVYAK